MPAFLPPRESLPYFTYQALLTSICSEQPSAHHVPGDFFTVHCVPNAHIVGKDRNVLFAKPLTAESIRI